jgi:hypothetical protein
LESLHATTILAGMLQCYETSDGSEDRAFEFDPLTNTVLQRGVTCQVLHRTVDAHPTVRNATGPAWRRCRQDEAVVEIVHLVFLGTSSKHPLHQSIRLALCSRGGDPRKAPPADYDDRDSVDYIDEASTHTILLASVAIDTR